MPKARQTHMVLNLQLVFMCVFLKHSNKTKIK